MRSTILFVLVVFMLVLSVTTTALAVDYYVDPTGTDDGSHGTATGTDAWATIEYAVNNVADPTTATIVINVSGATYTLNSDVITIDRSFTDLTIQGAGAGTTIVQAAASYNTATEKVFDITSGETVTLKDMTIRYGKTSNGSGIYSQGTLTLTNCAVSDNVSSSDGGGICSVNGGPVTLINCTVNDNVSGLDGGGIYIANGDLSLTNCTITGNTANNSNGDGGGLKRYDHYQDHVVIITNCTFTENSAAEYGGGIDLQKEGFFIIKNTILANNSAGTAGDDFRLLAGTVYDNGYNIVEDSDGYTFSATGDITGEQASLNISSTLADNSTLNGTQTLALETGSVAINAGTSLQGTHPVAIPTTDQRGLTRVGETDIGAYEFTGALLPVELANFHAEVVKEGVKLHWSTAVEINNAGFNLYKDGQLLTFVNGNGTTNEASHYEYLDTNVERGKLYTYEIADIEEYTGIATRHPAIAVIAGKGMVNDNDTPAQFSLHEAYPNPFNPTTTIEFNMPESVNLSLAIYDVAGKLIKSFANSEMWNGGSYSVVWNGKDDNGNVVSSGTYFCKMVTEKYSETKAMVLLK